MELKKSLPNKTAGEKIVGEKTAGEKTIKTLKSSVKNLVGAGLIYGATALGGCTEMEEIVPDPEPKVPPVETTPTVVKKPKPV